jgi:N-acetylmuramoyl-L-alanine amidase
MKFCSILLSAMVFLWLAPLTEAVSLNGQSYVSLADWARANGFYGAILARHGDEIILTNHNARLLFTVDSAEARINGVHVRLCFPIAAAKNVPFVSQLDVDDTLRPLIYLPKPSAKRITTICLDPGHGGKDSGNRVGHGFFAHSEKTYTLALAMELRDQLRHAGFNVILTRNRDIYVDLPARPALANHAGADLFISLHFNATQAGAGEVSGPETYCITPVGAASSNAGGEGEFASSIGAGPTIANRNENKSVLLAYQVQKSLVRTLSADDRGVRRARFAVLRDAMMPAILIEGGYMTNPREGPKIYDAAYRQQMAAAITRAILNYQKLTAPMPPVHKPTSPAHPAFKS